LSRIFAKYLGLFKSANWDGISSLMVEKNGVFHQSSSKPLTGAQYFKKMWYGVDESGLDKNGVDRYDEINSKSSKSDKKIDGKKRL